MWTHVARSVGWSAVLALAAIACDDGDGGSTPAPTPDMSPACPEGTADCPCAAGDTCGADLVCTEGVCRADDTPTPDMGTPDEGVTPDGGCTAGTQGCACADGACGDGLVCEADLCVEAPAPTTGLRVEGAGAKGCEALLKGNAAKPVDVGFADGVTGQFARRGSAIAVAFISATGGDLMAAGGVRLDTGATATAADLTIESQTCFDLNGRPVMGASVVLD